MGAAAVASTTRPTAAAGEPTLPARALGNVLVIAGAFCLTAIVVVLVAFDGWDYYRTPLAVRGYHPAHSVLRPSGTIGLVLGIGGMVSMLGTLPYFVRKRWQRLARLGTIKRWLEIHIFFGIVGPVLITLHTSFKFNGLISVGYWLMMAVWVSGFVGRYLYVRIPKSIRGIELSAAEVEQHLSALRLRLDTARLPESVRRALDAFQSAATSSTGAPGVLDLFFGELRVRVRLAATRRQLRGSGVQVQLVDAAIALASERATLARRLAHLKRTHRLFDLWHVFHRPLVSGLFVIAALHVGIAIYLGYVSVPF
jgi:hypothetical protein